MCTDTNIAFLGTPAAMEDGVAENIFDNVLKPLKQDTMKQDPTNFPQRTLVQAGLNMQ